MYNPKFGFVVVDLIFCSISDRSNVGGSG